MSRFTVLAQSFTDSQRIEKIVAADSEAEAIRAVTSELDDAGFYPLSVTRTEGLPRMTEAQKVREARLNARLQATRPTQTKPAPIPQRRRNDTVPASAVIRRAF